MFSTTFQVISSTRIFLLEAEVDMVLASALGNYNSDMFCHLRYCDATLSLSHEYASRSSALLVGCAEHLHATHPVEMGR